MRINLFITLLTWVVVFTSCVSEKKTGQSNAPAEGPAFSLSEKQQQQMREGLDFSAKGEIPASWTLEFDWNNIIRFRSVDGNTANSTAVQGQPLAGESGEKYVTSSTYGPMEIEVINKPCSNAVSGEKFSRTVTVRINGKSYEGCGAYLANPALEATWRLIKIDSDSLSAADFPKGLPELRFDIANQKASGHDGCNLFGSTIQVLGSQVKFMNTVGTKMACPGHMGAGNFLTKLEGHFAKYSITGNELSLYTYDDSKLYFVKLNKD